MTPGRPAGTSVVADGGGWALDAWQAVLARDPDRQPFATLGWQRAWWAHFGTGERVVVPLVAGGEAVGVAALHRDGAGVLRFLGGPDLTDYPGPALVPGAAHEAAETLVRRLRAGDVRWRELDVRNARPRDGFAAALGAAAGAAGLRRSAGADEPVAVLELPGTWDALLARLARHVRHEVRRKERRMARERPQATVRTADARTLEADLGAFFALHRQARGPKGRFMDARTASFFSDVATDLLHAGTLRLDVLEDRGRALAMTFGIRTARDFFLYNMAFDPAAARWSPGTVLLARLLRRSIAEGLDRFDFLRGLERYKLELGATPSHLMRVRILAP